MDVFIKPWGVEESVGIVGTSLQPHKKPNDGEEEIRIAIIISTKVHSTVVAIDDPAA